MSTRSKSNSKERTNRAVRCKVHTFLYVSYVFNHTNSVLRRGIRRTSARGHRRRVDPFVSGQKIPVSSVAVALAISKNVGTFTPLRSFTMSTADAAVTMLLLLLWVTVIVVVLMLLLLQWQCARVPSSPWSAWAGGTRQWSAMPRRRPGSFRILRAPRPRRDTLWLAVRLRLRSY